MTTYSVTSSADDGSPGTLRYALAQPRPSYQDMIVIASGVSEIHITSPLTTTSYARILNASNSTVAPVIQIDAGVAASIAGFSLDGVRFYNSGTIDLYGYLDIGDTFAPRPTVFQNTASGTMILHGAGFSSTGAGNELLNLGHIVVPDGDNSGYYDGVIDNQGSISVGNNGLFNVYSWTVGGSVSGAGEFFVGLGGSITLAGDLSLTVGRFGLFGGSNASLAGDLTYGGVLDMPAGGLGLGGHTLTLTGSAQLTSAGIGGGTLLIGAGVPFTCSTNSTAISSGTTVVNNGTLSVASGSLQLGGVLQNKSIVTVSGSFAVGAAGSVANSGTFSQTGSVQIGDMTYSHETSIFNNIVGGTYNLAGDVGVAIGLDKTIEFNNSGGTLAKTAGAGTSTIAASFADDSGAAAQIQIQTGTLAFSGDTNSFVDQTISGAGTFAISGGVSTIGAGTSITTSSFAVTGDSTLATLAESLSYAGDLSIGAGATLALAGRTLILGGAATVAGTISGAGRLVAGNGLTITGSVTGGTLAFGSGSKTVVVATGAAFDETIDGLSAGDAIDLQGLAYAPTDEVVFSAGAAGGTVQIIDPTHGNAARATFAVTGSVAGGDFSLAEDAAGGTTLGFAGPKLFDLASGDVELAAFDITGQPYTGTIDVYDATGHLRAARYTGVTGQAYQAFETDYSGGNVVQTQFFYSGVTGQPYTTETLTVNAAGQQTAVLYGGLTSGPYASYEYDFASGLFAGSKFTLAEVPAGASYSSFETDSDFAGNSTGAKFFTTNITGQSYTGEEVDTDAAGSATRVLLTGYNGQPYQRLEFDYASGAYTGYKSFATEITGQSYTGLEEDVTAAGQLTKVVYTGLTTTPYSTLEQDYTSGTLTSNTFTFKTPASQSYSSYSVTENAAGAQISETVYNTDGSHIIVGSADNLIFEAIGNDKIKGGGSSETFDFNTIFGHDTITDFSGHTTGAGHDTISLSSADFASFAALSASAQDVSGGVAFTGKSGSQITLQGINKATLAGLGADFAFHA